MIGGAVNEDELRRSVVTITFDGTAGKGAIGTGTVFTVTGEVLIERLVPFCTVNVGVDGGTGAASVQLGIANATTLFVASTGAVDIDADEFWIDATPDANGIALPAALKEILVTQDVQFEVTSTGTQKVNAGSVRFTAFWRPISADGLVA